MFKPFNPLTDREQCVMCMHGFKHNTSRITDNIYICDLTTARCRKYLTSEGFEATIDVSGVMFNPCTINHLGYNIIDNKKFDITKYLDKVNDFIVLHFDKKIIINCSSGINSSVAFIVYYMMRKNSLSFIHAYNYVKLQRPAAKLSDAFIEQLKKN
jgi:hypothetical protein